MQTFLPYPDFVASARSLDRARLGKQRLEALQILRTLRGETTGWKNHPAVRMWRNHEPALQIYGVAICLEWIRRGYQDSLLEKFGEPTEIILPSWFGDPNFHRSHQANLVRKDPEYYIPQFGDLAPEEYVWPVP